jgi:chaperonin GroES
MRYEPLANRVIMEPVSESKRTAGGLHVPDVATRNKGVAFGKVIATGPGRVNAEGRTIPCSVKIGDIVLFPRQAPAVLPILDNEGNETMVLMCPDNDIIAVVHDLPRDSGLTDINGQRILAINPQSSALADSVYANRDGIDRTLSDLKGAPPEILAEIAAEQVDQDDHSAEVIEA